MNLVFRNLISGIFYSPDSLVLPTFMYWNTCTENQNKHVIEVCFPNFLSNFYFFNRWQPFKNYVFYFIEKAIFVLEIFKFLYFFPFIFTPSRFKKTTGSGLIYVMNWLHKFADVIFGISQKPLYITSSNLDNT